jgi:O-antigen ligase
MPSNSKFISSNPLAFVIAILGIGFGLIVGFLAGMNPIIPSAIVVVVVVTIYFLTNLQQSVLGLLIIRSSLDCLSAQQVPAAFAIGLDVLIILYIAVSIFRRQIVYTDTFCFFLVGWVFLQSLWVILLPFGGLGLDGSFFIEAMREWVRLFSWTMVYLTVMQLKNKIHPEVILSILFLSLVAPILVAFLQILVPSILPPQLSSTIVPEPGSLAEGVARIRGTFGHPNTFTSFTYLFIGLTYWKINNSQRRWFWLSIMALLVFIYVTIKALFAIMMLAVFMIVIVLPRLNILTMIGVTSLFAGMVALFGSTDFGQKRLDSISGTPLLNPDLDVSRAILLSKGDNNSFNWRLAQWDYLMNASQQSPLLGFGLGLSAYVSNNNLLPHNDYVRALIEGGQVGLICFLVLLIAQFIHLVKLLLASPIKSRQKSFCYTLIAIFAGIPVGMITENIWSHTTLFFYWFTLVAIAGWDWEKPTNNQSSTQST